MKKTKTISIKIIFLLILSLIACSPESSFIEGKEADSIPPVAVSEIIFSNVSENGVTVSWGEASDDITPASELQYKLLQASSIEELNTIEKSSDCKNIIINWSQGTIKHSINGLIPNTKYVFAVLVLDIEGNITLYEPKEIKTTFIKVIGIGLNKLNTNIPVGGSENLTFTFSPSDAADQNVTWTSSDTSKATVSTSGLVTGVEKGTSTITVKTTDGGFTANCVVSVISAVVVSTGSLSDIAGDRAKGTGNLSDDGGGTVTAYGLCWSTTTNPTINNSKTIIVTGTGSFISYLTGLKSGTTYYVRAYATNICGTVYGNNVTMITPTYNLRDVGPAGGLIFYENPNWATDGWRYLEAAPLSTEWSGKKWGGKEYTINATGTAIGTGKTNTAIIVNWLYNINTNNTAGDVTNKADRAASLCDSLVVVVSGVTYDDWFLPSKDELWQMCWVLSRVAMNPDTHAIIYNPDYSTTVGDFGTKTYWGSTEQNDYMARRQNFEIGQDDFHYKDWTYYVRAIRSF